MLYKYFYDLLVWFKYYFFKLHNYKFYTNLIKGKKCLEVGGPSNIFKGFLPLYQHALSIDGVNFSNKTLWSTDIDRANSYNYFMGKSGKKIVCDAVDLFKIDSSSYDILISSNCIEHIANPIKALKDWRRVLRKGGFLILVIPNKLNNFDRKRNDTSFEHILSDYLNNIKEDDLTHLNEIIEFHDMSKDPWVDNRANFIFRCENNLNFRSMHHHVFNLDLISSMLEYAGFNVINLDYTVDNFFVAAHVN